MEESIHVILDDKLDHEKSKLCEKHAYVMITFPAPKEKFQEDKESEAPPYDNVDSPSNLT